MERFFLLLGLAACGGTVTDPIEGGGAGDAGPDATVDTGTVDTGIDSPPVVDCKALEAQLAQQRMQILTCCPVCGTIQCNHVTMDVCCPISTTATNVSAFEALVAQYKKQCNPACPAIPCKPVPSNVCMPGANPNAPGVCQ
jgi:hypothetical protein